MNDNDGMPFLEQLIILLVVLCIVGLCVALFGLIGSQ